MVEIIERGDRWFKVKANSKKEVEEKFKDWFVVDIYKEGEYWIVLIF